MSRPQIDRTPCVTDQYRAEMSRDICGIEVRWVIQDPDTGRMALITASGPEDALYQGYALFCKEVGTGIGALSLETALEHESWRKALRAAGLVQ